MFSLSSVKESKSAEGGPFPLVDLDREVQISGGGGPNPLGHWHVLFVIYIFIGL